MATGDFPCSICGNYFCSGIHNIWGCFICGFSPCTCLSGWKVVPQVPTTTITWPPPAPRLHPDDIEKIARRVLELLKDPDAP